MIPGLSGFAPDVAVDSAPIGIAGSAHAAAEGSWLPSAATPRPTARSGTAHRGVRHAQVGELRLQVVVRLEAGRRHLAVGQPGKAHAVDVVGGNAAVGVGGWLGPVVLEDVRQHLHGGRPGRVRRVAAAFQQRGPRPQVVGHVVGGLPGVVQVLLPVGVDERVERRVPAAVHLLQGAVAAAAADRGPDSDLRAREDNKFDIWFRSQERNGFGRTRWEGLFLLLRGLPFSSVTPEYYNLRHDAINFVSQYRWDAQKRRVFARISGPFEGSAKYRFEMATDLREENWVLVSSFAGPARELGSLNLRREELGFALMSHATERLRWSAAGELSHRDFRSVSAGTALTPELLAKGIELKQKTQLSSALWRLPERRFTVDAEVSSEAARLWSTRDESFERLQGSVGWHWLPRAEGDDLETRQRVRAGKTFGSVPFDELFMLGLERDNDLPLRGHIGTRDGRKGSAPLGRDYFLANWETDKNLYGNGLVTLKLGPFLDTGKITDPGGALGSRKWLWDTGAQVKLLVFGSGVVFSYGKDLRSGNNAFYVRLVN